MTDFIVSALPLVPYDPFTVPGPYAGEGPVFVHADGCEPRSCAPGEVPDQVAESMLSVRAYDEQAMMVGAEVLTGARLAERASALVGPGVAFLHVHFAGPGCSLSGSTRPRATEETRHASDAGAQGRGLPRAARG